MMKIVTYELDDVLWTQFVKMLKCLFHN